MVERGDVSSGFCGSVVCVTLSFCQKSRTNFSSNFLRILELTHVTVCPTPLGEVAKLRATIVENHSSSDLIENHSLSPTK